MSTPTRPELQVAQIFMANKGYPKASPVAERYVDDLPGQLIWEFDYRVSNGKLTIEVVWQDEAWDVAVLDYSRKRPPVQPDVP